MLLPTSWCRMIWNPVLLVSAVTAPCRKQELLVDSSRSVWAQQQCQAGEESLSQVRSPCEGERQQHPGTAEHLEPPHTVTVALLSGTECLATVRVMGILMN